MEVFLHGQTRLADAVFQSQELVFALVCSGTRAIFTKLRDVLRAGQLGKVWQAGLVQFVQVFRVAEVEERALGHLGVVENAVQDFQLGDGMLQMLREPGFARNQVGVNRVRDPAVAFPEQPDEVWAAALDDIQTDGEHLPFLALVLGDAPAQVHLTPGYGALFAQLAQLREDKLDQVVALRLHIAESGGDENTDVTGLRWCHDRKPSLLIALKREKACLHYQQNAAQQFCKQALIRP